MSATAIWGLGVVLCFAGWGGWLKRRLVPDIEVDWGLLAAWGLALTLAVGGALCLLGLARRPVLLTWTLVGIAFAGRDVFRSPHWRMAWPPRLWELAGRQWDAPAIAVLLALAGLIYVGSAARGIPNPSDDWIVYLPFMRMILQTGTLVDPFSVRRMAAYGGQSYLQALSRIGADHAQIQIFDQGICLLLIVALLLGFARQTRNSSRLIGLLLVLLAIMLPEIRQNSGSEVSGALCFLAAFRSMTFVERIGPRGLRRAWLVALPLAAICTLRQNYLAVVAFMMASLLLGGREPAIPWAERRRHFIEVALLTGACLLPWAVLAFRSNHTFLFPVFPGNYDPHYAALTSPASWSTHFKVYLSAAFYDLPIQSMPIFLLAAPAVAWRWKSRALLGLWIGTVVGFALLALSLPETDNYTIARYTFAFQVAFVLAIGLTVAEPAPVPASNSKPDVAILVLVLLAMVLQIQATRVSALRTLSRATEQIDAQFGIAERGARPLDEGALPVQQMQGAVPPGQRLLVMIERPYHLDYSRNRIDHLDLPGAASPPPRFPLAEGGDKVASYLLAQGIRYFAFTLPDAAQDELYSRAHWKRQLTGPSRVWRLTAPLFLSTFDAVDQLAKSRRHLYDDGHLVVVDLGAAAGAP
jgi:hypothetical protein